MFTVYKSKVCRAALISFCTVFSIQSLAGSSSVQYPKIKNNGNTWHHPSPSLSSYYGDYFIDMDRSYKSQVIHDKQFSESLLNVCGEVSALFYRYLHNQNEKPLFNDTAINNSASFQRKEALPFLSKNSQYAQRDMYVEYPRPSRNGKYRGQFVYEYKIASGNKSVFQLDKNLGGGNGKSREIMFIANMANYYVDENGNKQTASKERLYVVLKVDRLTRIKSASSESGAFQMGKNNCAWLSKRLK